MDCETTWIQCGKNLCGKWRIVREEVARKYENLPWSCEMNESRRYRKCSVPEEEIETGKGKKIVLTKFPYNNGEIVMAKISGYCSWPALICPDPYCEFYYDAVLNEKGEEDEITHIHVEFFGWPRTHAWVTPNNISSFCETKPRFGKPMVNKSNKLNKSYENAMEEALNALSSSCEERLQNCTFKTVADLLKLNRKEPPSLKRKRTGNAKMNGIADEKDFLYIYNQFKAEWGRSQAKPPVWNGKAINLYKIFQSVQDHGGYIEVTKKRMWLTLRDGLLENSNSLVKSSGNLKLFYEKYMLDFEMHLKTMKGKEIKRKKLHEITNYSAKQDAVCGQSKIILSSGKVDAGNDLKLLKSTMFVSGGSDLSGEVSTLENSDMVTKNTKLPRKRKTYSPSASLPEHTDYINVLQDDCDSSPSLNHEDYEVDVTTISQDSVESLDLAPKANTMISSGNFVPSSNSTSPNVLPMEEIKRRKSHESRTCSAKQGAVCGQSSKTPVPTILSSEKENAGNDLKLLKSTIFVPGGSYLSGKYRDSCLSLNHKDVDVSTISENSSKSLDLGSRTNTMISSCDFVPSSNPTSPKVFPMEEDIENDCEISIRRELEEMESLLASLERTARKGNPVKRKHTNDEGLQEDKTSCSLQDNEVKDAIRDIFEVEEHISQLEGSTELDFL